VPRFVMSRNDDAKHVFSPFAFLASGLPGHGCRRTQQWLFPAI
jgi:hypothetical protein